MKFLIEQSDTIRHNKAENQHRRLQRLIKCMEFDVRTDISRMFRRKSNLDQLNECINSPKKDVIEGSARDIYQLFLYNRPYPFLLYM